MDDADRRTAKNKQVDLTPGIVQIEDLAQLRAVTEIWIDRAANAVWGFGREDGSFWTNSKAASKKEAPPPPHITTTARAYVALQNAHRARGQNGRPPVDKWVNSFSQFVQQVHMEWDRADGIRFTELKMKDPKVNIFDVAHFVDFIQVDEYISRFQLSKDSIVLALAKRKRSDGVQSIKDSSRQAENFDEGAPVDKSLTGQKEELRSAIVEHLTAALRKATQATDEGAPNTGEVQFDDRPESAHYFATLHALRALHTLGAPLPHNVPRIVEGARAFAVEQCFFYQRGATHRQDALRLAFACSIYAIYGEHVDQKLCLAIVEALHQAQQENGSWPATHPILRENDRPWHIASHEVALCLTWLYFQSKLPDAARPLLVSMMRRYLLDAVAPTFFRAPTNIQPKDSKAKLFDGWQDDHTVGTETTVGWATAIICHFLANFSQVLDDWINRRIIEDLNLELATEGYLIDDVVGKPAKRWQRDFGKPTPREVEVRGEVADNPPKLIKLDRKTGEVWPDLPPHAWSLDKANEHELAKDIFENWTDPSLGCAISKGIARVALVPILSAPDQRPAKDGYAGLMPGKPGTRKTTLVGHIAKTIHWPKIAVPASLIFAKGFDQIEAQANNVFDRLNHLRRCVIFFDEFEEFFVSRKPEQGLETSDTSYKMRTIAAFTTSAMLPRLQQLHDQQRCLIFLATNHSEKMDSAIKRRGRFDFQIEVNHPTAQRLLEYLKDMPKKSEKFVGLDKLSEPVRQKVKDAVLRAVDKEFKNNPDREIRFTWVEELLTNQRDVESATFESDVREALIKLINSPTPDDPPRIEDL
jgi:hypothetical protein